MWSRTTAERSGDENSLPAGFAVQRQSKWLPKFYRPASLGRFTSKKRLGRARAALERRGCSSVILYAWNPAFAPAFDLVAHEVSCYHIADEYTFSPVEQPTGEQEKKLISRVDQVFIHSPALMEKKGHLNPRTLYVTNGVDYEAFAAEVPEPADLTAVPRPRVGYIGRIKVQLDWEVLSELARRHPEFSFVFVGPMGYLGEEAARCRALFAMPNVFYLGDKSVGDIPGYTRHLDACLLCYAVNDYTKYIFPLKLHEYLASGRPVVGSAIRSLYDFRSVVKIAETPDDWSRLVAEAVRPESVADELVRQRREVARAYDWNKLVARIAGALCERLGSEYKRVFEDVGQGDGLSG